MLKKRPEVIEDIVELYRQPDLSIDKTHPNPPLPLGTRNTVFHVYSVGSLLYLNPI